MILWFAILTAPSCRGTTSFAIHISTLVVFGYSGTGARIAIFFICCPDTTIFCRISNKTENTKMSYEKYIFNPCLFVLHTIYIGMYIFLNLTWSGSSSRFCSNCNRNKDRCNDKQSNPHF